ncbi:glyoxysomal processing protease, glyoxysomal-like [Bidens hawaiensis]|uniref:glyoxysomal processing protease, glyoxysomal-like n=1 Tax=Bidens hawaiensis TaxID=980011 RepID=UPI0040496637
MEDHGFKQQEPTVIHCDNKSTIHLSKNPVLHSRSKHIELMYHFIREMVINKQVQLEYCSTHSQLADVLIKGLSMEKFLFIARSWEFSVTTTLSSSGIILPNCFDVGSLVITVASIIEPFFASKHRDIINISSQIDLVKPELIPGAQIDIMTEGNVTKSDSETHHWLPAELMALVDIRASSAALQSLMGASSGSLDH